MERIRRIVMRNAIAPSLLLAALAAGTALADPGFSAGASLGYSNITLKDQGVSVDFNDVGYKVFGAYTFNDNFGVEGGWIDFGNASENVAGSTIDLNTDGFDLYAVGNLPMSENFDLFAKIGFLSWDASGSIDGFDAGSDSGEDLALGFGGRVKTGGGFALRAEYEWFDIKDTDSAWMLSAGFEYSFR
jgi:OOP family OmpA-OmpF porin